MELLIKGMISKFWGRFLVIKHEMEEKYAVKSYFSENFLNLQQTNCKFEDRNEGSYTKMDNLFVRRDAFSRWLFFPIDKPCPKDNKYLKTFIIYNR